MGLEQFRACYPMGGVITELVLYEQGQYVVRCCLEVDGRAIATGLSAAHTVEAAEDQARDRAVALWLKIPSPARTAAPVPQSPPPAVIPAPPPAPVVKPAAPIVSDAPAPAPIAAPEAPLPPVAEPEPAPIPSPAPEPALSFNGSVPAEAEPEPEPDHPDAIAPEPEPTLATPAPAATGEPIDFSDVIAKTNLEMKRLGWSNEQGRQYIMETYGKRSRQFLADHELVEFLRYLESLSS